ncbi:HopJ type III effector protein [Pokkaliibacter sp. CJK22405]|uniref:HopJ type III effector protein n=1 Tax=Pokkaliibacter sp. CJK22405 TaxID=3384615 RepID=UPI003984BDC4
MSEMTLASFLEQIGHNAEIDFEDTMGVIHANYDYHPTSFTNGQDADQVVNDAGTNEGSCKIFAFAKRHELSESQTLACFGRFYRDDVLNHPEGSDHRNIRQFMRHGWQGIQFAQDPLIDKAH